VQALEVRNLVKSFGDVRAVDGISFTVPAGGVIYGLIGRNGAGKTTTIRTIMDIYLPDAGEVLFYGKPRGSDFHRRVSYLPEERGLYKGMTVLDNLLFLAEIKGVQPAVARPKALAYLERFELGSQTGAKIEKLSKGNQQKVQFIGAVLHEPELLVLDEPFSGLDPVNSELLKEMILELRQQGRAVVLSTHVMEMAERICDHVTMIDQGKLLLNASPATIKAQYSQCRVSLQASGDTDFLRSLPYVVSSVNSGDSMVVQV
jgi:ABC-2 type transport system ATP-binding protein